MGGHRLAANLAAAVFAALLALAPVAGAGAASAQLTFAGNAESGRGRVQVEVDDPALAASLGAHPDPSRFRAIVGNGDARISGVSRVAESGEPVVTVMAFDRSGSFKHYWDEAFALADAFADAMPATPGSHSVEVMTFHGQQYWHGTATTGAELRAILRQVESLGPLGSSSETTLMSAVQEGARRAAEKQPENGARQLLLFTDAGEEGVVFSVDETIAFARTQGVPVHPVILKDNVKQKQLDRTKKLADESGGRLQHGGTDAEFRAAMAAYANAGERLFWLQLSFCGVHPPPGLIHFDDNVSVEVLEAGVRKAITVEAPFRQHAADGALADCATAPIPPPTDPTTTAVPDDDGGLGSLWPWMLGLGGAGLFGLLLLLLFLLLRRRKKDPSAAPQAKAKTLVEIPPAPPVTASGDAAAAAAVGASPGGDAPGLKKGWVNPLKQAPLPDTRLHVVRGPTSLPQYLFVNRKEFSVGASAGEVDQVIDLPKLSGKHATFLLYPLGDIYVTDHSTNGTFVDGQRIPKGTRVKLNPGQRIRLANEVELRLDQPGSGGAASAPADPPAPAAPPDGPPPARAKAKTVFAPVGSGPGEAAKAPSPRPGPGRPKPKTIYQPLGEDEDEE